MSTSLPVLPETACAYEAYDPITLHPSNDSTYIRLLELGWTRRDFEGKSVLDIGTNSGILAVYAHQLGAARVQATDVQAPLVEFFGSVVAHHGLPIDVQRKSFSDLTSARDSADVVLLMEVLHWIVDQGGNVPDAIDRLAALTRETLFLETPWDVKEPSIARKGLLTDATYSADMILRELTRHFAEVRIVRFMTYFGRMDGSKRVLIRASRRRDMNLPLTISNDANRLDVSIARGSNAVELITTRDGPMVLKRLPASSPLTRLDDEGMRLLFGHLGRRRDPVLVPPAPLDGTYRCRGRDNHIYMLLPYVGRLSDCFPAPRPPAAVDDPVETTIALREYMRDVPAEAVERLRASCGPVAVTNIDEIVGAPADAVRSSEVSQLCRDASARVRGYDRSRENCVVHGDMQRGNMVTDRYGRPRVVDLDLMRTGTAYFDLLTCAIFCGAAPHTLAHAVSRLRDYESRGLEQFDIDLSVVYAVGWLKAFVVTGKNMPDSQLTNFIAGLRSVAALSP